jgi:hypothetical protein
MVTKNEGGREGAHKSTSVWHCGDRGLFLIWMCTFFINNLFPFPLATALLLGIVTTNRWSGVKMFLSVITAPIVLAQIIYFSIRRCHVNWIFILQIRSAMPIQDMNMSAPIYWRWRILSPTTNVAENVHILNRHNGLKGENGQNM